MPTNITIKDAILTIRNEILQMRFSIDDANIGHAQSALKLTEALCQWVMNAEKEAAEQPKKEEIEP